MAIFVINVTKSIQEPVKECNFWRSPSKQTENFPKRCISLQVFLRIMSIMVKLLSCHRKSVIFREVQVNKLKTSLRDAFRCRFSERIMVKLLSCHLKSVIFRELIMLETSLKVLFLCRDL